MAAATELETAILGAADVLAARLLPMPQKLYTLVEAVTQTVPYPWASAPLLALYQKLFITQAGLCRVEERWAGRRSVMLDPVHVYYVEEVAPSAAEMPLDEMTLISARTLPEEGMARRPNRHFFLDARHFHQVTEEEVAELLAAFWRRFDAATDRAPALAMLGLGEGVSWPEVESAYRRQISRAHPDRGGSASRFIALREAYECLRACRKDP